MTPNQHVKSHKQCSHCQETFQGPNSSRDYRTHLKTHQPKEAYNCQICQKSFPYKSYLERHAKSAHNSSAVRKIDLEFDDEYLSVSNEIQNSEDKAVSRRKQKL